MPIFVETISNSPRPIPFLRDANWKGYPNLKAAQIVGFLKLCRSGRPIEIDHPVPGMNQNQFDQQHQKAEFLKGIEYLRKHCQAGSKA